LHSFQHFPSGEIDSSRVRVCMYLLGLYSHTLPTTNNPSNTRILGLLQRIEREREREREGEGERHEVT
jgi:hypothetical protein